MASKSLRRFDVTVFLFVQVRLDIWHFMRRLASTCTTEAHLLYPVFLARLSRCIFEWDSDDVARLKTAKRAEMGGAGMSNVTDDMILSAIGRRELARHCRRRTRGAEQTAKLVEDLLTFYCGPGGLDMAGMPLLDKERTSDVWESQKKHVACIQDLDGVQLYLQTGSLKKGDVELPVYRCARGSTSLESFHLHLNRFVPGWKA